MQKFFSLQGVFTTRNLAVMAMMVALSMVLARFGTIYITPQFRLFSLAYLPGVMVAMLYGPWAALAFGLATDTVSFLVNPGGAYFIGFALSEMLSCFIYACFLYNRPLSVWRVTAARLLVTVLVLLGLNFVWQSILWGALASVFYSSTRMVNHLIQFPIHVALIIITARLTQIVTKRGSITL